MELVTKLKILARAQDMQKYDNTQADLWLVFPVKFDSLEWHVVNLKW
jgi:hypothetical protein